MNCNTMIILIIISLAIIIYFSREKQINRFLNSSIDFSKFNTIKENFVSSFMNKRDPLNFSGDIVLEKFENGEQMKKDIKKADFIIRHDPISEVRRQYIKLDPFERLGELGEYNFGY